MKTFWDKRYDNEGHIWGDAPSITATETLKRLEPDADVLEIGSGYGRDMLALARAGHHVIGVEQAEHGVDMTTRQLIEQGLQTHARAVCGDILTADLPAESFDAIYSHRTLHLLTDEDSVLALAEDVDHLLRPGGLLAVSARDHRGNQPGALRELPHGIYEYTARPGHFIRLWDGDAFREYFGPRFEIESVSQHEELESEQTGHTAYLTLMIARKGE